MDSVIRAAFIYFFLLVVFRIAGRRTLSEMTTFDFVLLLILGEATEPVLLGDDPSITDAMWAEGVRKHYNGNVIVGRSVFGMHRPSGATITLCKYVLPMAR